MAVETVKIIQPTAAIQTPPTNQGGTAFASQTVIEIGTLQAFLAVAVMLLAIGVAWGTFKTLVRGIKKVLEEEIKPDLKNIRERFAVVEDRVQTLWRDNVASAHSPRKLNDYGRKILNESGIKEIIEEKRAKLFALVKEKEAKNAYDAEQVILSIVDELPKYCPDVIDRLKTGAFRTGASIETVLLVGGVYLRDLIFSELGFSLDHIDQRVSIT